jgi:hypothetical protein
MIEEAISQAYSDKGFYKTNIDWGIAVEFAKNHNADISNGDGCFNILLSSEVTVRFLKKPKNGTVVIAVINAEEYRQEIEDMQSGNYDPSKYPSYKLEF